MCDTLGVEKPERGSFMDRQYAICAAEQTKALLAIDSPMGFTAKAARREGAARTPRIRCESFSGGVYGGKKHGSACKCEK